LQAPFLLGDFLRENYIDQVIFTKEIVFVLELNLHIRPPPRFSTSAGVLTWRKAGDFSLTSTSVTWVDEGERLIPSFARFAYVSVARMRWSIRDKT
jgi:hypothetical protein